HGGKTIGSAGCIDVGREDIALFKLIKSTSTYDGTDNILVEVTEYPNGNGWNKLNATSPVEELEQWWNSF
ncbi:hypothetical protein, partial [Megamonas funiformis]